MRRRILTAIIGVVVLATAVLTLPLGVIVVKRKQAEAVLELDRAAERTAAALDANIGQPGAEVQLDPQPDGLAVAIYDTSGRRIAGKGPAHADAITSQPGFATVDGVVGPDRVLAQPVTIDDKRVATIRVAEPLSETTKHIRRDLLVLFGVDVLAVTIAAAVGAVVAGRLTRPLRDVRDDAVSLGYGDFAIAARYSGVAEIDETSHALADTASRLDAVLQRERTFSANASHQLRTPVTSMRLAVESELAVPRDDHQEVLHDVLADLDRLESTITTLLAVARDLPREYEPVDVHTVMASIRTRWEPVLARHHTTLSVTGQDQPKIRISTQVLDEILDVLIDNADRHGTGPVTVTFETIDTEHLVVTVADHGELTADPTTLFLRRPPGTERHGLGLALARSLAEAEGGRLVVAETAPTTFRLILPDRR